MISRGRVIRALGSQEPDRVPFEITLSPALMEVSCKKTGACDPADYFGVDVRKADLDPLPCDISAEDSPRQAAGILDKPWMRKGSYRVLHIDRGEGQSPVAGGCPERLWLRTINICPTAIEIPISVPVNPSYLRSVVVKEDVTELPAVKKIK